MTQTPTEPTPPGEPLQPHRGALVLVLGILGLVLCVILGIIAWVMGNNDLREMRTGRMDPAGQGLTQAGRICGMVSVALWVLILVVLPSAGAWRELLRIV